MSEVKDNMEDAGEKMKRDTKKAGNRMEEGKQYDSYKSFAT
jgi:hypothetical protein